MPLEAGRWRSPSEGSRLVLIPAQMEGFSGIPSLAREGDSLISLRLIGSPTALFPLRTKINREAEFVNSCINNAIWKYAKNMWVIYTFIRISS